MNKKITLTYFILAALLLPATFFSCTDDLLTKESVRVQEGLPATVTLGFRTEESKTETRAAQDAEVESRVNNLYVFIFDRAGELHYQGFFVDNISYGSSSAEGTLTIQTTSLNDARIVCIANISTSSVHTSYEVTQSDMDAIKNFADLENYVMYMNERTVERSTQFMMTGYAYENNDKEDIYVTIPGAESGTATLSCTLAPERTDAKVQFIVKTEKPADKNWTNLDFRPTSWRVVNVPAQSLLLPDSEGKDAEGEYFATEAMPFEIVERDENYLFQEGGFTFYMAENLKSPELAIPDDVTDSKERYALREKRDKENEGGSFPDKPGQEYEQGDFTYAPKDATYVEMNGTLSYTDGAGYTVNADVTFTVHLGDAANNANDYKTERNTSYTYTVTLRGVDNIVVEVTNENGEEPRPGYEGDVVFSQEGMYELDAHYDRALITIDRSKVNDMTWGVQTPFGRGIYSGTGTPEEAGIYDYKWIKFAVNDDYGAASDSYVKYPGDQNYKGGDDVASPSHSSYPEARLLDVYQLMERLKEEYAGGQTTGTVSVTAFIDEYVYATHPENSTEEMISRWREYVEAEDRLLYLVNGENSQYSPDGASSVIEAMLTFKQHSIRSVYNVNKSAEELPTAWGLETIMEGRDDASLNYGRLLPGDVSRGSSRSNGRLNTINCILNSGTLHWTDVLNTSNRYELDQDYRDALHAVLMRNRDLDGDDIVDRNEIRWYLAAIDQLVDIYLGEYALDEPSRLYPESEADRPGGNGTIHWHYTSSSNDNGNPWVLWAEERAAMGNYATSVNMNGKYYSYRCLRNLGLDLEDENSEPTPLIPAVTQAESDGTYIIDVTNMSEKARRLSFEAGQQQPHDDLSPQNRPYGKFRVASVNSDVNAQNRTPACDYDDNGTPVRDYDDKLVFTNNSTWGNYTNTSLSNGYRIPNLRELLIMATRLPEEAWKNYEAQEWYILSYRYVYSKAFYMAKTSYSLTGEGDYTNRNGFQFNANDGTLGVPRNTDKGYVRGVKDELYE